MVQVGCIGRGIAGRIAAHAVWGLALSASAQPGAPDFRHAVDGSRLVIQPKPDEPVTPQLREFLATGVNEHRNRPQALARGQELFEQWCQVCHGADASGGVGPALTGPQHVHAQTSTDAGMFAIVYAGANGAMLPFARRDITLDEILQVIAYVRRLGR